MRAVSIGRRRRPFPQSALARSGMFAGGRHSGHGRHVTWRPAPAAGIAFPGMKSGHNPVASESKTSAADVTRLLERLTVPDLGRAIAAAERQREARREAARRKLLEEFRARAAEMGLSPDELLGDGALPGRPRGKARSGGKGAQASPRPARYRDPETGETWSGRGRVPRWLKAAEQRGRKREKFAVGG